MNKLTQFKRLKSLDALRGLDMIFLVGLAGMFRSLPDISENVVFVWLANQTRHPEWQGFTAYDIIFPLFIFIVGVAIPFSFNKRLARNNRKSDLIKHVFFRSLVLTILGVVLWQVPGGAHPTYGFYSVLYRIGFSYFFASLIYLNTNSRSLVVWAIGILIFYWILMRFIPVPDYGIADFSREGNLATYIHNWVGKKISPDFSYIFSPTLLTSISNALIGVIAGLWLMSNNSENSKTKGLLIAGIMMLLFAGIWHLDFPVNKKLASPSFTLLTCGISSVLLGIFYYLIDVKNYQKWAFPIIVVGVNPITIYVADFLINFQVIANVFIGEMDFGSATSFILATTTTLIIWLFMYYLYRQKVFFKI